MRQRRNYGACAAAAVMLALAAPVRAAMDDPLLAGNDLGILQKADSLLKTSGGALGEVLAPYPATALIEVGRVLREHHRPADAKPVLALAFQRPLTECELAEAKYQMALACEALREGPEVIRLYGEIVRDCPDSARALEAACRLAELQTSVILPGCAREPDKARAVAGWAVSRFSNRQDRTLGCRNLLGQLCWEKQDWLAAHWHFLAVYETDPAALQLPYGFIPDNSTPAAMKLETIRGNWAGLRPQLVQLIVNTCASGNPVNTEAALTELMNRRPGSDLAAKAKEKLAQLQKRTGTRPR